MIQDIYKNARPLHLGVGAVGDTGALIRLLLRRLLAGRHDRGILTTRIPHERCRDPLHHKRNLHDGG